MTLKLVPPVQPPASRCHFKLAHQQGRGRNRMAIYVCKAHESCSLLATRGWTNRK